MKYNIIIPVAFKDYLFLRKTLYYINMFLNPEHIYIITNKEMSCCLPSSIKKDKKCTILDEDNIVPFITFKTIDKLLHVHKTLHPRTGWYLQQFIKLGFALSKYCNTDYYLSWDADTLPIRHIEFFDQDNKPYFSMKSEYHQPYFNTIKKVLNVTKVNEHSYISEHMMFNKSIVKNLIENIDNNIILGNSWFEKIIFATEPNELCPFSEFETYGNFCMKYYPDLYVERQMPSFRCGGYIMGRFIKNSILKELSIDLSTISFEIYHKPPFPWSIASSLYEKYIKNVKYKEYLIRKRIKTIKLFFKPINKK